MAYPRTDDGRYHVESYEYQPHNGLGQHHVQETTDWYTRQAGIQTDRFPGRFDDDAASLTETDILSPTDGYFGTAAASSTLSTQQSSSLSFSDQQAVSSVYPGVRDNCDASSSMARGSAAAKGKAKEASLERWANNNNINGFGYDVPAAVYNTTTVSGYHPGGGSYHHQHAQQASFNEHEAPPAYTPPSASLLSHPSGSGSPHLMSYRTFSHVDGPGGLSSHMAGSRGEESQLFPEAHEPQRMADPESGRDNTPPCWIYRMRELLHAFDWRGNGQTITLSLVLILIIVILLTS